MMHSFCIVENGLRYDATSYGLRYDVCALHREDLASSGEQCGCGSLRLLCVLRWELSINIAAAVCDSCNYRTVVNSV